MMTDYDLAAHHRAAKAIADGARAASLDDGPERDAGLDVLRHAIALRRAIENAIVLRATSAQKAG